MMGSSWPLMVLLILCVLHPMLLPVSRGCFAEERAALMEIHASLVRANSTSAVLPPMPPIPLPPWGEAGNDDCCSWERVRCSNVTRRVSHLDLAQVYGPRDPDDSSTVWNLDTTAFAAFPELQFLDLSINRPMSLISFDGFKKLSNLRELDLSYNSISGNLPSFPFSLPRIEVLDLSENMFEGHIPISSSSNLSLSLRSLRLSLNNLSGRFSLFCLKDLINLVEIDLSSNADLHVTVNIPGWVPRFQLKQLYLSGCNLDKGVITKPKFLGTQHHLEDLDLSYNNFSVGMPNWLFRKGSTLVTLNLGNNSLTGSVDPIWWYTQTSLQDIDISMNQIVGQLPANISSVFPSLRRIVVSNTNFSGEIPKSLCQINTINTLILTDNRFSGEMPTCLFTDLPDLYYLKVTNNQLGGPVFGGRNNLTVSSSYLYLGGNKFEGALPRMLSGDDLWVIDLHDNKLTGELDASSWNLPQLHFLDVSSNYMTGEIHPQICDLPSIEFLDLWDNLFTGPIRTCNSKSLESFDVSMNSLSGVVSWENFNTPNLFNLDVMDNMLTGNLSWVHRFQRISTLSLGYNVLHGQIPSSLCELRYLRIIDLSHNKLFGPVPPCVGAIPFNHTLANFEGVGSVPEQSQGGFTFGTKGMHLAYNPTDNDLMSGIDLSGNMLSGEIPWELGELSHVMSLNLSRNALVGRIPASLVNMSNMESLDLSHNELTGAIPLELTRLWSLAVFSVAYNHLSGCVPNSGQFSTFDKVSYEGNNQLEMDCSSSPTVSKPGSVPPHNEMVVDAGPYVIGAASFVLMFWVTVAFSFFHSTGRRMVLKLLLCINDRCCSSIDSACK